MDLVYHVHRDHNGPIVVFAERGRAEYIWSIHRAINESETWGQFRAALPTGEWESHFLPHFEDWEEEVPADDEPFNSGDVPGYDDGDYPGWPAQEQLDWFPKQLIEKYAGRKANSVHSGEFLELPGERADEIAAELRAMGHTVERTDQDL
ncbi:hypothetical protein [Mycobacterium sp. 1274756.6]|uniref:hypothetical protein n=1 Tax=Mycobacterium sp. 1274756.6 TaxID=1834076 RepID=UPI0012E79249|nr:hypothetical protein [Mycobacterium sp. 1274756.6]